MKNILKNILTIKIIFLIIVLNFSFLNLENANAAINKQINYQGRLLDSVGDPVADAGFNIQFKLYTVSTGGTAIWTETHCYSPDAGTTCDGTGTDSRVDTVDGLFSVMLGSVNSLDSVDFNQTLYLGINIGGTATTPSYDGEMSPRKILGSVPAAFEADKLDGINSAQFFRNDVANSTSSATTFFSLVQSGAGKVMELFGSGMSSLFTVLSGGNVGIGTSTPEYDLQIHRDSGQTDFAITTNTNVGSANTATIQFISDNDGTQNPAILGQFNDGSLRFSGGGNIVTPDMVITDAGYVGIGTTTPDSKFLVQTNTSHATRFSDGSVNYTYANEANPRWNLISYGYGTVHTGLFFGGNAAAIGTPNPNTNILNITTGGTERMRIDESGNVGIGTTSPYAKLSVNGSAAITGALYDSTASAGTNGYILQTTGSGISWVATSSLGFVDTGITSYGIGDTVTSGTAGSVLFVDSSGNLAQDNTALYWDSANNRLGIGTTTPGTTFSVGNTNGINITDDGRYFAYTPSNIYTPVFKIEDSRGDVFSYTGGQNYVELNVKTGLSDSNASWVGNFGKGDGIGTLNLNFNAGATTIGRIGIDADNNFVLAGGDSRDFNFGVGNSANFNITTGASSNISAVAGNVSGSGNLSLLGTSATSNNTAGIITTAGDSLALTTASTTRVTVTSAGNVGIGTTSPYAKLSVNGSAAITGALYDSTASAGTNGYILQTTGSGISWVATSSIGIIDPVNIGEGIGSGTAGSVLFVDGSGNLGQDNAAFYWDTSNDRLGIGTNSPDYALDVAGGKIGIDGNQVVYRPDQTNFSGTLIIGNAGASLSHTSGSEGWENTYVGINAGYGNTTGLRNTAVGKNALIANTTGFQNNAFGSLALDANITSSNNSAFGYASLTNSDSSNNSAFGNYSLGQITTGHTNSAFGYLAGYYLADGVTTLQTGNTSTYFGASTRASADGVANENVFGYGATGVGANSVVLGNSSVTKTVLNGNVGIGSTSPNSKLVVSGETVSQYFTATSTTASTTLPNLDATNIEVAGKLYDSTASAGTSGYVLQTTGTGIAWVATSSLGTVINPGGSNTQVQFNDSGSFGGDSGFTYNKTTDTLSVNGGVEGVSGDYSYSLTSLSGLSLADDSVSKTSNYNASSISFDSSTFLSTNYLNFTSTIGSSGYGIRNNAGTIEFRNSAGDWTSFDALEPSQPIYAIGSVSAYSGSSLPSGWLWADGSAISRTTYADLFALIGTTYGSGDGSTTFNLPDLRGRTIAGKDNMDNTEGTGGGDAARLTSTSKASIDGDTLGSSGGVQEYTLQAEESGLPAHTHTYLDYYHASVVTRGSGGANTASAGYGAASRTSYANTAQDAAEAHTNVQPTLVLNYIIRYTNSEANAAFWSLNGSSLYNTTASVGIGTTTPARALHVAISTDGAPVRFQDSNGYCEINPTSTTWTCTSDERLKENILSISSSTPDLFERMMKLRPVTFEWKTDETNAQRVGFIAQEVEVLFPEFVSTDAESGLKSVSYGSFVPYVISMFQELANKVELLAKKIDDLTSSGIAAVGGVITKLTIGSEEKPTGITLFDESTGDPYCVSVKNGNMVTKFGECTTEDDQEIGDSNDNVQKKSYISDIEESDEQDIPYPDNIQNSPDPVEESDEVTEQSDVSENTLEQSDVINTENITETPEVEPEVGIEIVNEDDVVVETNSASGSVEIPLE